MSSGYGPPNKHWSSDEYSPHISPISRVLSLGFGVGAIGGGLYFASQQQVGKNLTAIDMVQNTLKRYGYNSPFSLMNTFRGAEWLSPFVSTGGLGMKLNTSLIEPSKEVFQYIYEPEFLKRAETHKFLYKTFPGFEDLIHSKKGLPFNFNVLQDDVQLVFEADPEKSVGKAFLRRIDTGKTLPISSKVSLFDITETEAPEIISKTKTKANTAFYSINQATGLVDDFAQAGSRPLQSVDQIFRNQEGVQKRFAIIESPTTTRGLSVFSRAFPAFGMERLNRLLLSTVEQIPILGSFTGAIDRAYNFDFKVQSGTASKMFARYGLRAGAIGATVLGIEQLDYYRRNYDLVGDVGVSAIMSLGVAGAFKRIMSSTPTKAAGVGAAAFVAQMILPGFEEGTVPGLATVAKNIDVGSTAIGELTFMNSYRRFVEGMAPGISDPTFGAFAGVGLAIASGFARDPISSHIFRRLNTDQKKYLLGENSQVALRKNFELPFTLRRVQDQNIHLLSKGNFLTETGQDVLGDSFAKEIKGFKYSPEVSAPNLKERFRVKGELFAAARKVAGEEGVNVLEKELSEVYAKSLAERKEAYTGVNVLNESYLRRMDEISRSNLGKSQKLVESLFTKLTHSFFGASFQGEDFIKKSKDAGVRNRLGRFPFLFAAGLLGHQLVTGGLLGSMENASEKEAIYSGQQLVGVKRGRWWEGGGTPFAGRDIMYHRPHQYHQLMTRAKQKSIYGEDEDSTSPIGKFFLKNFTYDLERMNYFKRPYPVTAGAFEDIPIIGNILAATVGQVIKPTRFMHANELFRVGPGGQLEYKNPSEIDAPGYSIGGKGFGMPGSPHSVSNVLGNLQYQFRELEGLTGWAKNIFTKALTGEESFGIQKPVFESASRIASSNKDFWDMELGGALFLSEPLRRFFPKERSMIQNYNPLVNSMPSWLPERFHYGDPYRNIGSGDVRLPGSGYEALHPELKGYSAEAYPDIYKYKILSDVAPTSKQFLQLRENMYRRRSEGILSQKEQMLMDQADKLLNKRTVYQDFQPHEKALDIPIVSQASRAVVGGAVDIFKDSFSPMEYMVPMGFRPSQKLLEYSNPIDQYEYQRLYGTMFSFWDKPIRDWFRPAFYSAAHAMGYDGTPAHREKANQVNEYFDKLEFYKQMQLAGKAEAMGNTRAKQKFLLEASRTKYGINPQAHAMSMYQALPDGEKEFFDAFAAAKGADRERILEMVPRDQVHLYQNIFSRVDAGDRSLYPGGKREVDEQFLTQRFYELDDYFDDKALPEDDWIGWHEDASLDDVKVRYTNSLGMDLYDVDMYESKLRAQSRREYLSGSEKALMQGRNIPGSNGIMNLFRNVLNQENEGYTNLTVTQFGDTSRGNFYMNDDRRFQIMEMMKYASE